jgi:hypothetical protein
VFRRGSLSSLYQMCMSDDCEDLIATAVVVSGVVRRRLPAAADRAHHGDDRAGGGAGRRGGARVRGRSSRNPDAGSCPRAHDRRPSLPTEELVAALIGLPCIAALTWFFQRTCTGIALRALVCDRQVATAVGIGVQAPRRGCLGAFGRCRRAVDGNLRGFSIEVL